MGAVIAADLDAVVDDAAPSRRIEGRGTPERRWQAWQRLAALPLRTMIDLVPAGRRVVVVAPHPDDEILGCGGLLAQLAPAQADVVVIGVTDGEASHPGSTRFGVNGLSAVRAQEREAGLRALGLSGGNRRLGFADGSLADSEAALTDALLRLLDPGDVVLTTWHTDGHPDHEAVGRSTLRAARALGCRVHEMPVWMWHWAEPGDPRVPWHRLVRVALNDDQRSRKRRAIAAHASQLEPDGSRPAILPDWALARVLRPFDYFFVDSLDATTLAPAGQPGADSTDGSAR